MSAIAGRAVAVLSVMCFLAGAAEAAQNVVIAVGEYYTISGQGIRQAAVSDPTVADIQPVSLSELLVAALSPGTTQIIVWDCRGKRRFDVTAIAARPKLDLFANMINAAIVTPGVTAEAVGSKLMLRGEVETKADQQRIETTAKAIYPQVESLLTVRQGASAATLAAVSTAISSSGLTAQMLPDGKILVKGSVKDSGALESAKKSLEPWVSQAEFVYDVSQERTPRQEAIDGLTTALSKWHIVAMPLPDGGVILQGAVSGKEALDEVSALAKIWSKNVRVVLNVSADDSTVAQQVLIRSRVIELDRTYLRDLGVDWSRILFGQNGGFSAENQPFIIGQPTAGPFPLFGGPPIEQLDSIGARVTALIQEDKAHLLSQPSLVTESGKPANILIGGEIPIPVPQSGTGGFATITIEYKEFGIRLFVLPTVGENGEIAMLVRPEVSALDFANGIEISGIRVPGLRTRKAESTVHVSSGQSIAIGGLLSQDEIKDIKRIPLLSKIPILGNFFKHVSTQKRNSELLIIVTPEIVCAPGPADVIRNVGPSLPLCEPLPSSGTCPPAQTVIP